jgi:hypothetical protein
MHLTGRILLGYCFKFVYYEDRYKKWYYLRQGRLWAYILTRILCLIPYLFSSRNQHNLTCGTGRGTDTFKLRLGRDASLAPVTQVKPRSTT